MKQYKTVCAILLILKGHICGPNSQTVEVKENPVTNNNIYNKHNWSYLEQQVIELYKLPISYYSKPLKQKGNKENSEFKSPLEIRHEFFQKYISIVTKMKDLLTIYFDLCKVKYLSKKIYSDEDEMTIYLKEKDNFKTNLSRQYEETKTRSLEIVEFLLTTKNKIERRILKQLLTILSAIRKCYDDFIKFDDPCEVKTDSAGN